MPMLKKKKDETYVQKAILELSKTVNDQASYISFISNAKILFETNNITENGREEIKTEIAKQLKKNNVEISEEDLDTHFAAFRTVSEQDYISMPTEEVKGIKKLLNKKVVITGTIVLAGIGVSLTACGLKKSNSSKTPTPTPTPTMSSEGNQADIVQPASINVNNNETNPLLAFDPQDKQVLIDNIYKLFKNSIPKGHKVTNKNVAQETANWTEAYLVANIENIGPDFLLKYLQNDSKDSLSMIENYLRVVSQVNSDAQVSENSWDLSTMFANKSDAELVARFQKIVRQIVIATKAKNKSEIREKSVELRKELEKLVKSNGSRQYSNAAIVMSINLSFSGANVAKINGMANVVIPSDLRGVVYTDGAVKCIEATKAGKGTFKENYIKYGGQDNVYMKAILGLYEETEKDITQMITLYSAMNEQSRTEAFNSEISYNSSQNTLIEKIKGIMDTYKANKSYKKLYYKNLKVTGKVKTTTKTTVVKSSTAKKITKKKKNGKKVTVKDIDSKDFEKGTVTGKSGKKVTTTSKKEQQLVEQATNQGYSDGYARGMSKGSAGKAKSIGTISVPSKFAKNSKAKSMYISQFKTAFSKGYSDGYKIYKDNKNYKQENTTGSKTEESGVKNVEEVKKDKDTSSSSNNSSNSGSSSSSGDSKTEESDVYDIEDVEVKSVSHSEINEIGSKISSLKKIRNSIANLSIEQSYEEEISHTK